MHTLSCSHMRSLLLGVRNEGDQAVGILAGEKPTENSEGRAVLGALDLRTAGLEFRDERIITAIKMLYSRYCRFALSAQSGQYQRGTSTNIACEHFSAAQPLRSAD